MLISSLRQRQQERQLRLLRVQMRQEQQLLVQRQEQRLFRHKQTKTMPTERQ